jgi:putative transposase
MAIRAIYDRFDSREEDRFWDLSELQKEWRRTRDSSKKLKTLSKDVPSMVANFACLRAEQAYKRWWKGIASKPQEKKHKGKKFTIYKPKYGADYIKVPNIGQVKTKEHIRFEGNPGSVAFSQRAGDRWWASFSVETEDRKTQKNGDIVGIDWGLNSFVTLSNGEKVEAPKPYVRAEKRLKRLQRQWQRKEKGSNNRKKLTKIISKAHFNVAQIRKDFLDKLSTRLTKRYSCIVIEDLNMAGMVKNKHLSKAIQDSGAGKFFEQLEYKGAWYGCEIIKADRWYPSSQTCSECRLVLQGDQKLQLHDRTFKCPECGFECDRDLNAAKNLESLGRGRFPRIYAPGESLSRAVSVDAT